LERPQSQVSQRLALPVSVRLLEPEVSRRGPVVGRVFRRAQRAVTAPADRRPELPFARPVRRAGRFVLGPSAYQSSPLSAPLA